MKTVKYKLSGTTKRLFMKGTDFNGIDYEFDRCANKIDTTNFHKGYYLPEEHYSIQHMTLKDIAELAVGSGSEMQVARDVWVKLAKVILIKEEPMVLTKEIELEYLLFKPKVKFTGYLTCEEIL